MASQNIDPTITSSSKNLKDHSIRTTDKHSVTKRSMNYN